MAQLKDVAEYAKVSQSTVSRVINNPELVKAATRDQVRAAMAHLGYTPQVAETRTRRNVIGLALPDINLEINAEFIRELGRRLEDTPYDLLLFNLKGNRQMSTFCSENAAFHKKVDALIITSARLDDESIDFFRKLKLPIVVIQSRCQGEMVIGTNNYLGGQDATRHLLDLGHRKVAFVGWDLDDERLNERLNGYRSMMESPGPGYDKALVSLGPLSIKGGYQTTAALYKTQKPEAIFYASDSMAFGGLKYFREHGIRVPEDISLVGFDNLPMSAVVGLTTMKQFIETKIDMAVSYLLDKLAGKNPSVSQKEYSITPELIVRDSTMASHG